MEELYTKLFVNSERSHEDLLASVAQACAGKIEAGWTVVSGDYEMDVRPNDEGTEEARRKHPGDFLYYPFIVEVVTEGDPDEAENYVGFVGALMAKLYENGMKVVASCDWEDDLPGCGRLGA